MVPVIHGYGSVFATGAADDHRNLDAARSLDSRVCIGSRTAALFPASVLCATTSGDNEPFPWEYALNPHGSWYLLGDSFGSE